MYKVILADDEIWSLEGLAASFQWEENGFQVVGKYTDSLEAVRHIKEECPDVVFTDIRMPDMTGLEMMGEIRKNQLDTVFIIVSGYAEFEYAREAVRQGAFDYNLKPIDLDEADRLLKRLKNYLDERRYVSDNRILQQILYEGREAEGGGVSRFLPLSSCEEIKAVVIHGISPAMDWPGLWKPFTENTVPYVKLMVSEAERIVVYDGTDRDFDRAYLEFLKSAVENRGYAGVSSGGAYGSLSVLLKEAILAASGEFIGKETGVTEYSEIVSPYYETYGKKLCSAVLENKYEEACAILDGIVELVKKENLGIFYIARLWNQIAILLHENLRDGKRVRIEYLDFFRITRKFKNVEELNRYLKIEIAEILISQKEQIESQKNFNENFMKLLEYVDGHYDEKLNLNSLSERFFLNMSYCSELFKKVTHLNFSDYVTKIRMEKAAALLSDGRYMAREVAEMTGYSDAFYFSKVFKKYYGVTPAYFLQGKKEERNHLKSEQ